MVYALRLPNRRWYVGETTDLNQRLQARAASGARGSYIEVLVAPVASKDAARAVETRLINALAKRHVKLLSAHDGNRSM